MKKTFILIASLLILTTVITGCASSKKSGDSATKTKANNLLAEIKTAGKIRIGTEGTYAPYTFHDSTGKLTGFDVDVAEAIAKKIGVKTEFIETKWDGMFAGLDAKRFDIIVNQVGINADRQKKYDFSDPYISSKAVLIVRKDNTSINKFEDLKGKKSAQSLTSNLAKKATSYGATLVQVDGFNQSIDLLTSKRVDATINDSLSFLDLMKQKPDSPLKVVAEESNADTCGVMLNKGNKELLDATNKALADIKADGTYSTISNKYFGTDVSK